MGDNDRPLCNSAPMKEVRVSLKEVQGLLSDVKMTVAVIRNETEWLKSESGEMKEKNRRIWEALDNLEDHLQEGIEKLEDRVGVLENQHSSWKGGLQTILMVINAVLMSGILLWCLSKM